MCRVSFFLIVWSSVMTWFTDHILTLQHSLAYYERMLSEWSSTYISQLRAEISITKNKADINLLYLTTVAACCQTSLILIGRLTALHLYEPIRFWYISSGACSMNVHVPQNLHASGHPFFYFIGVVCLVLCIICTILLLVRRWWNQSKRRPSMD